MRDREEDSQDLAVRNFAWIEDDLHRFSVAGASCADLLVSGAAFLAPRGAGEHVLHAFGVLKYALYTPEAAAGEDGGLGCGTGTLRTIDFRHRKRRGGLARASRDVPEHGDGRQSEECDPNSTAHRARRENAIPSHEHVPCCLL